MKLNGLMAFALFSVIMLLLDAVYLNVIAGEFGKMIGKIQGSKMEVNMGAAAIVLLFGIGMVHFHLSRYR